MRALNLYTQETIEVNSFLSQKKANVCPAASKYATVQLKVTNL